MHWHENVTVTHRLRTFDPADGVESGHLAKLATSAATGQQRRRAIPAAARQELLMPARMLASAPQPEILVPRRW